MRLSCKASHMITALMLVTAAPAANASGGFPAQNLDSLGGIPNSVLTGAIVGVVLALAIRLLLGRMTLVPSRGQALVESVIEGLRGMFEPIVGRKAMPAAFPLLLTFFLFILFQNWSGLIPGVGTIGWGHETADGHFEVTEALIRPFTSDYNGTLALAAISFGAWLILIFRYAGPRAILFDLFGNKADRKEIGTPIHVLLSFVFLLVGCIEVLSILIRPVTLSARLFGNVFGGEQVLHATHFLFPFYFLEILVGLVQALVFTLLTAVYVGLICNHGDDHHGEGHH